MRYNFDNLVIILIPKVARWSYCDTQTNTSQMWKSADTQTNCYSHRHLVHWENNMIFTNAQTDTNIKSNYIHTNSHTKINRKMHTYTNANKHTKTLTQKPKILEQSWRSLLIHYVDNLLSYVIYWCLIIFLSHENRILMI